SPAISAIDDAAASSKRSVDFKFSDVVSGDSGCCFRQSRWRLVCGVGF
ncbi:unnamed protein product, partial [Prunus brigantina]